MPLPLMSATCQPTAVHGILESLKIIPRHINFIRGELTRPEIRLIRMYLKHPLILGEDLAGLFPHASDVENDSMIPTIIYLGLKMLHYRSWGLYARLEGIRWMRTMGKVFVFKGIIWSQVRKIRLSMSRILVMGNTQHYWGDRLLGWAKIGLELEWSL